MTLKEMEPIFKKYFENFNLLRSCGYVMLILENGNMVIWFSTFEEYQESLILRYDGQAILQVNKKF